ncbi:ATP-binding cassette domain-containing protein [Antricoccus suffuscus]|nr:ATP-binding cassette domain-containing protein [Antricoccus suffuscus]
MSAIISATDLSRHYRTPRASMFGQPGQVIGLDKATFEVEAGERFGIVGESGSGKSTLLRLLAGLDEPTSGHIEVDGLDISRHRTPWGRTPPGSPDYRRNLHGLRSRLQMVFQDPMGSLDPQMRVYDIVAEPLVAQRKPFTDADVHRLLRDVGIDPSGARRYPHQFSGGQRQRISIARALAPEPSILVADEPVSALDVSVRAQVLNLITDLVRDRELTLVFVSHDLSVVRHLCRRVAVMKDGQIVELSETKALYANPQSDYTRRLVAAIPTLAKSMSGATTRDLLTESDQPNERGDR